MMDSEENIETIGGVQDHTLTINPEGFKGQYGCMVTFDNGTAKTVLRYKLNIYWTGKSNQFTNTYRIDREPHIFINDKVPEDFLDKLAVEVSQVIYPLEVETTWDGKLNKILNFEAIVERWEHKKKELPQFYKGDIADRYLQLTDQTLSSPTVLFEKLTKDWCIQLYFSRLYVHYSEDFAVEQKESYPIAGKATPVTYTTTQYLERVSENDTNDITLRIEGKIDDERSALDLEQELDIPYHKLLNAEVKKMKGKCELMYVLEEDTGIIETFEANFETKFSVQKKVNVRMSLLKRLKKESAILVEEDDQMQVKKGFWAKLFNK